MGAQRAAVERNNRVVTGKNLFQRKPFPQRIPYHHVVAGPVYTSDACHRIGDFLFANPRAVYRPFRSSRHLLQRIFHSLIGKVSSLRRRASHNKTVFPHHGGGGFRAALVNSQNILFVLTLFIHGNPPSEASSISLHIPFSPHCSVYRFTL